MEFTLNSVWNLTKEIQREQQRLSDLRDAAERITRSYADNPRSSTYSSRIDRLVALIADTENHLRELYDAQLVQRINMMAVIRRAGLTPTEERVLELRYVHCLPFNDIAGEIAYAESYTFRIHRQAKEKLLAQFDGIVSTLTSGKE